MPKILAYHISCYNLVVRIVVLWKNVSVYELCGLVREDCGWFVSIWAIEERKSKQSCSYYFFTKKLQVIYNNR